MENYTKCLELEQKLIEIEEMLEEMDAQNKCSNCGKFIEDWEDVEYTGTEVILTYKCTCGHYVALHHRVVFDRAEVIQKGDVQNV